jgi:hypothetical protein
MLSLMLIVRPVNAAVEANAQACNNVVNGASSPDYVWVEDSASGLTVYWSQAADKFGTSGTTTVRACVTVDGTEYGAWSQNTANDGSEFFPWSVFGLSGDPCPDETAEFQGSVDSPVVQTKKSDVDSCSDRSTPTPTPTETPVVTPTPTPTPEQSVEGNTGTPAPTMTPEQSVEAATGTPGASVPDTAVGLGGNMQQIPVLFFGLLLIGSLGGLVYLNVRSVLERR